MDFFVLFFLVEEISFLIPIPSYFYILSNFLHSFFPSKFPAFRFSFQLSCILSFIRTFLYSFNASKFPAFLLSIQLSCTSPTQFSIIYEFLVKKNFKPLANLPAKVRPSRRRASQRLSMFSGPAYTYFNIPLRMPRAKF